MNKNLIRCFIIILFYYAHLNSCPHAIFITRHAEKTDEKIDLTFDRWHLKATKPLSTRGWQRAYGLVPLFTMDERLTPYGHISALFAPKPDNCYNSVRPIQTLTPLAKKLDLKINSKFELCPDGMQAMVDEIMHSHKYDNTTIWIAYEHKHIPTLANLFKKASSQQNIKIPDTWPNQSFDRIWILEFDTKTNALMSFKNMPQRLLIHDSEH